MEMEYGVFGEDILVEILKRLPKKYMFRFRCVSKGWLHLLSDRTRISPTTTETGLLLYSTPGIDSTYLPGYPSASSSYRSMTFLRVANDDSAASVVHSLGFALSPGFVPIDSCNGLLLIAECSHRKPTISSCLVYNPATKHSEHVPPPHHLYDSFSQVVFAFDGHHYQLIFLCLKASDHLLVFSSQTGEWRVKHVMIPHLSDVVLHAWGCIRVPNRSLFLKGAVHWLLGGSLFIYHLKDEHLKVVELPRCVDFAYNLSHCIWNSEGCLNYCHRHRNLIYIWVLCMNFEWRLKHIGAFTIPMLKSFDCFQGCDFNGDEFENVNVMSQGRHFTYKCETEAHLSALLESLSSFQSFVFVGDFGNVKIKTMPEFQPCAFDDDFEIVYLKSLGRLFAYKLKTRVMKEVRINPFEVSSTNKIISDVVPFLYT